MNDNGQRIEVVDATLGAVCQVSQALDLDEKVALVRKLAHWSVDYIKANSPYYNVRDREFFLRVKGLSLSRTSLVAVGPLCKPDAQAEHDLSLLSLLAAETPVVCVVGNASADHVENVLNVDPKRYLTMIEDSVRLLVREGRQVFFDAEHCFDGFRRNEDFTVRVLQVALEAGADRLVLCDTNGGSLPEQVAAVFTRVRQVLPETVRLGINAANDGGLAVANTLAAVGHGATLVQGTVNGVGARCGNADLIPVVANLGLKLGHEVLCDGSMKRLTELSHFVSDLSNLNYSETQPFVGQRAFSHNGGLSVTALREDPTRYSHVLPEAVGNHRQMLVGDLSGQEKLIEKLLGFGVKCAAEDLVRIVEKVVRLEELGYQFATADASLHLLVLRLLGRHRPWFETQHYKVLASGKGQLLDTDDSQFPDTDNTVEAVVRIKVGGEIEHEVSEGTGPVHALDLALRKALRRTDRDLAGMKLTDYAVRVIRDVRGPYYDRPLEPLAGTGSRVRVTIQSQHADGRTWGTVAVSRNILSATWAALVDTFEYKKLLDLKKVWGVTVPGELLDE